MRNLNEQTITQAVLDRFADTPDPRLKAILDSLVRHIHGFVREIEPTMEEWSFAIGYLTATGQMCDDKRQEFILLSDTLGISTLVDAINHRAPHGATETAVLGPFYRLDPPEFPDGADISGGRSGQPLSISGRVRAVDGTPVADAVVDVWHSDEEGFYDVQAGPSAPSAMRARLRSDDAGRFRLRTVMPSHYPIPVDGPVGTLLTATRRHPNRPAHVHFRIAAPGYRSLVTQLFADDSPFLDGDAVFGVKDALVVPYEQRPSAPDPDGKGVRGGHRLLSYDFVLDFDSTP